MARERDLVFNKLDELKIKYSVIEHPPVYTIEEMDSLGIFDGVSICKNLFVRNDKGNKHYLIVIRKDKQADLKEISARISESRLSFASEERLQKYLGLKKGEVTPLGIINDEEHAVIILLDKDLDGKKPVGVHPNDNSATVVLSFYSLIMYIKHFGNKLNTISI
ncbi:MAG: prolyl-tRNA synthetase associated domain-containing protein [Synergistaceae bacterium]|nr:prolyl-tRNA synthetase associated domain-containing protein [Synergistaceae bacterium]